MLKFLRSKKKRQAELRARAARIKRLLWLVGAKASDHGVEVSPPPPHWVEWLDRIISSPIEALHEDGVDKFLRNIEDAVPDMFKRVE